MRVAMLAPVAWRVPPRHYGPWERVVSLLTEGLVAAGVDVTLFATADSVTSARLAAVVPAPYEEDPGVDAKVAEHLHVAAAFERAGEFDLIHNHFDFVPLTYSALVDTPVVTTIHGFSSPRILRVYERYDGRVAYVAISDADRAPSLTYAATVHHGIPLDELPYCAGGDAAAGDGYLLFFGRLHPDKGAHLAIEVARRAGRRLVLAGIVQDEAYVAEQVAPFVDGESVTYLGSVGPERRAAVLGGADALLHLIGFDEPFGLSMVEAMACGTPVIATPRGSVPEVVVDGVTGFLVDSVPGAVAAVGRLGELDRAACRAHVAERFSVERMVEGYLGVYEGVLAGHRRAVPDERSTPEEPDLPDEVPFADEEALGDAPVEHDGVLDHLRGTGVGVEDPNIVGEVGPTDIPPGTDGEGSLIVNAPDPGEPVGEQLPS